MLPILNDRLRINGGKSYPPHGALYGRGIYFGTKSIANSYASSRSGSYGINKKPQYVFKCKIQDAQKYKTRRLGIWAVSNENDASVEGLIIKNL